MNLEFLPRHYTRVQGVTEERKTARTVFKGSSDPELWESELVKGQRWSNIMNLKRLGS